VFDSINRMEGTSIDWGQLPNIKRTTSQESKVAVSETQDQQLVSDERKEILNKELEKINKNFHGLNHSLRMKFNEEAEQFYVEVVDIKSREVIDSIPAKHMLDLAAKLKDMIGFFVDKKL